MSRAGPTYLAADVGKTGCRVRLLLPGGERLERHGPGTVGLATLDGPADVVATILAASGPELLARGARARACVATAGQVTADQGASLAVLLESQLGVTACAVTSDAVAAHVGALDGRPGVALTVGTGAAAVGVSPTGEVHLVDGAGQWLGDEGSGAWIGLEGLRAVVRAHDGRGPDTALTDAATKLFGPPPDLPLTIESTGNVPREAARFAPLVSELAASDPIAADIVARAARMLADTAIVAATRSSTDAVALVGGLVGFGPRLLEPWRTMVNDAGLRVVEPRGTALDGATRLCLDESLPHEQLVHRSLT